MPAHDQEPIVDGAVAVSADTIEAVGPYADLAARYSGAEEIGGDRYLLIPGLVNGHSHGRGLRDFQRGMVDNIFESWLLDTRRYLPVSTSDDVALSAIRLLKSGVTTTMHNHILVNPAASWFRAERSRPLMKRLLEPALLKLPRARARRRKSLCSKAWT